MMMKKSAETGILNVKKSERFLILESKALSYVLSDTAKSHKSVWLVCLSSYYKKNASEKTRRKEKSNLGELVENFYFSIAQCHKKKHNDDLVSFSLSLSLT